MASTETPSRKATSSPPPPAGGDTRGDEGSGRSRSPPPPPSPRPASPPSPLLTPTRRKYLFLGLALRASLLVFGLYQDAHSALPYTDIDYSVFLDGTRHLVHGCPLSAAVPPDTEPMQDLLDFQQPPAAPLNGCATGWLSIGARYILQHEDVLVARSKGSQAAEGARQQLGEDAALSLIEPSKFETMLLPLSLAVLKPLLKPLAAMGNPYSRPTFRYTPLLAALLSPGAWFSSMERIWGKAVFVIADILAAILMWDIARLRGNSSRSSSAANANAAPLAPSRVLSLLSDATHAIGLLWLLNPFPAQIATRGSSESVLSFLVLAFAAAALRLVNNSPREEGREGREEEKSGPEAGDDDRADGGAANNISSSDDDRADGGAANNISSSDDDPAKPINSTPAHAPAPLSSLPLPALPWETVLTPVLLALAVHFKIYPFIYGFSILAALHARARYLDGTIFLFTALYTFFGLSTLVYLIWGNAYLENSLLYHVTRIDHRHNFSPYFLPQYLGNVAAFPSGLLPSLSSSSSTTLASFVPQLALTLIVAWKIAPKDLLMTLFLQTYIFVLFNKVATSQYFIWYLHFVPILLPTWRFSSTFAGWATAATWVAGQAVWLASAYTLEFGGKDVFLLTWMAGIVYVLSHAFVVERCLDAWQRGRAVQQQQQRQQRQ